MKMKIIKASFSDDKMTVEVLHVVPNKEVGLMVLNSILLNSKEEADTGKFGKYDAVIIQGGDIYYLAPLSDY